MKTQDAIDHFGGVRHLSVALGVWPQAIYAWGDIVPPARALRLHQMTDGTLDAIASEEAEGEIDQGEVDDGGRATADQ